jgi:hypothetical protein
MCWECCKRLGMEVTRWGSYGAVGCAICAKTFWPLSDNPYLKTVAEGAEHVPVAVTATAATDASTTAATRVEIRAFVSGGQKYVLAPSEPSRSVPSKTVDATIASLIHLEETRES